MRIAMLTGGGDVPSLKPCIKAIVTRAEELGWETVGFRRGWAGPLHVDPTDEDSVRDHVMDLTTTTVRGIDRTGGTLLHTSRTNPGRVACEDLPRTYPSRCGPSTDRKPAGPSTAPITCSTFWKGCGSTLSSPSAATTRCPMRRAYIGKVWRPWPARKRWTMTFGTNYCLGFGTAVGRSVEFIDALHTPTASQERITVIELFGRNSGETALISGYLAGADRVLISEVPFDIDRLAALVMADKAANPSNYAIVVVSEGAQMAGGGTIEAGEPDAYGHRRLGGIGETLGQALKQRTGQGIVNQSLAYLMRAGPPVALDRMVASAFGTMAVQSLEAGEAGLMMALRDGNYETVPVETCIQGEKRVDVEELYDADAYRPIIRTVRGKPMYLY